MSAVVVDGAVAGHAQSFRAPRRARRWALISTALVVVIVVVMLLRARMFGYGWMLALMAGFFCGCVALLGIAVRAARLRVDEDGVAWGWGDIRFRMRRADLTACRLYQDGTVALVPRFGFPWHLSARDWEDFADFPRALRAAGLPIEEEPGPAPIMSRLQTYGVAMDLILLGNLVLAFLVLLAA